MDGVNDTATSGHSCLCHPAGVPKAVRQFIDHDGMVHPAGETRRFLRSAFIPYEDWLPLFVRMPEGVEWQIRQQRPEAEGQVSDALDRHVLPISGGPGGGCRSPAPDLARPVRPNHGSQHPRRHFSRITEKRGKRWSHRRRSSPPFLRRSLHTLSMNAVSIVTLAWAPAGRRSGGISGNLFIACGGRHAEDSPRGWF